MIKCGAAGVLNGFFKLYGCEPNIVWNNEGAVEGNERAGHEAEEEKEDVED